MTDQMLSVRQTRIEEDTRGFGSTAEKWICGVGLRGKIRRQILVQDTCMFDIQMEKPGCCTHKGTWNSGKR